MVVVLAAEKDMNLPAKLSVADELFVGLALVEIQHPSI